MILEQSIILFFLFRTLLHILGIASALALGGFLGRERLEDIDQIDREKNQQLIADILEFAGSLLNTYFQSQGMIDWRIFKIFLDLTLITGYDFACYKKRIEFLEALFLK